MHRYLRIVLCVLSVFIIAAVEDSDFSMQISSEGGKTLYVYMALALLAVCFLQNQLYNYLIPKNLRTYSLKGEETHYNKSLFKSTIGLGYFLVVLHLTGPFMRSAHLNEPEGFMYIGVALIFLGTLSKTKGIIANELSSKNKESS